MNFNVDFPRIAERIPSGSAPRPARKEGGRSLVPLPLPFPADKASDSHLPTPCSSRGNALNSESLPESDD